MTAHGRMLQSWEDYRILLLEGVKLVLGEEAADNFELRVPEGLPPGTRIHANHLICGASTV